MEGVVYRIKAPPLSAPRFDYVVVSDRFDPGKPLDLVTISNFHRAKSSLKKRTKKDLGVEFLVSEARKMSGEGVAKWLGDLREAYSFCKSSGCQFIISSGAESPLEMVSGKSFDAILTEVGIDSHGYWKDLDLWLRNVLSRKVTLK